MMAGDRVSAKLGVAVKANAQNATADAVVIWCIVFIVRSNQFEALGVFRTSRPSLIWSPAPNGQREISKAVIGAADGVACWACLFGFGACAVGAEIYEISGTWSLISLGLFIAAGYALSIFIR